MNNKKLLGTCIVIFALISILVIASLNISKSIYNIPNSLIATSSVISESINTKPTKKFSPLETTFPNLVINYDSNWKYESKIEESFLKNVPSYSLILSQQGFNIEISLKPGGIDPCFPLDYKKNKTETDLINSSKIYISDKFFRIFDTETKENSIVYTNPNCKNFIKSIIPIKEIANSNQDQLQFINLLYPNVSDTLTYVMTIKYQGNPTLNSKADEIIKSSVFPFK
jgi:hypothetical protein